MTKQRSANKTSRQGDAIGCYTAGLLLFWSYVDDGSKAAMEFGEAKGTAQHVGLPVPPVIGKAQKRVGDVG